MRSGACSGRFTTDGLAWFHGTLVCGLSLTLLLFRCVRSTVACMCAVTVITLLYIGLSFCVLSFAGAFCPISPAFAFPM
jgi:hypothetical protein